MSDLLLWAPTIDEKWVFAHPFGELLDGKHGNIPILLGFNKDETAAILAVTDTVFQFPGNRGISKWLYNMILQWTFRNYTSQVLSLYPTSENPQQNVKQIIQMTTDYLSLCPTFQLVDQLNHLFSENYLYMYNYGFDLFPENLFQKCHNEYVCHSQELPFLFHTMDGLLGSFSEKDEIVSRHLIEYWYLWFQYIGLILPWVILMVDLKREFRCGKR